MAKAPAPLELPSTCPPVVDGIRVGIGGWTFAPWRDNFYPNGLVQRRELEYASRHVSAIEVNGTWYGAQKPATYAKWRDEAPEGFVFSAKAPQRITMSRTLANTGAQVDAFLGDIAVLGDKLGPIVWQFDPMRRLQRDDFAEFLSLLPHEIDGLRIRHVLDVRVAAFIDRAFLELARGHRMATVFTDSGDYPSFADLTTDFVYARLMRTRSDVATGYPPGELQQWARRARAWASGGRPDDLPYVDGPRPEEDAPRDVFLYFISSAKERNPAAAMALLRELGAVTNG
jgi:uncharacterized protein YecE (DUF72 family)